MLPLSDIELLEEIRGASNEVLIKNKDSKGIPFLASIFRLHKQIFGETCSTCPKKIPSYINRLKNFKPIEKMENTSKNFMLSDGSMIIIPGTSLCYSNANLTDEVAIAYIAVNPNRKQLFTKLPENIDELVTQSLEVKEEEELITVFEKAVNVKEVLDALKQIGENTRATTGVGVLKKISELTPENVQALKAILIPAPVAPEKEEEAEEAPASTEAKEENETTTQV
jgi:hypothetical protein